MNTIAVIDYGMGNLHSMAKALEHVSQSTRILITADPEAIRGADRVVLPGVGAIRDCMAEIRRYGLDDVVREVAPQKPFLGVCVGLQALMDHSEENDGVDCLGLFAGRVRYFGDRLSDPKTGERLKNPHMGWNQVRPEYSHPLWDNIEPNSRFYFVHSYYVEPDNAADCAAITSYACDFASVLARENLFAVQFHPEKSQHAGLQLLENFVNWDGRA